MKPMQFLMLAAFVLISPTISHAQVAGSTPLGVTVTELQAVVKGWSVKRTVLGQAVYNDKDEKVGSVDDIIISPDKAVSYAIINAGGFLALAKHDVAIPVSQFKLVDNKLVLPGATKEALKAIPGPIRPIGAKTRIRQTGSRPACPQLDSVGLRCEFCVDWPPVVLGSSINTSSYGPLVSTSANVRDGVISRH